MKKHELRTESVLDGRIHILMKHKLKVALNDNLMQDNMVVDADLCMKLTHCLITILSSVKRYNC